jgi:hypothetical protein
LATRGTLLLRGQFYKLILPLEPETGKLAIWIENGPKWVNFEPRGMTVALGVSVQPFVQGYQ